MHRQWRLGKALALAVGLSAVAVPAAGATGSSWASAAAGGGRLVRVEVLGDGRVRVTADLCSPGAAAGDPIDPRWSMSEEVPPGPGSSVVAVLREGDGGPELVVPELGWTRWSLELSPAYLRAVCLGAEKEGAQAALRSAWGELLRMVDQRARDEASRLAAENSAWAATLSEAELTDLIQALTLFPVPSEEGDRWTGFLLGMPPGDQLLAVLRAAEGSQRAFFVALVATAQRRLADDPAFRDFCRGLMLKQRPQACPPLPERPTP